MRRADRLFQLILLLGRKRVVTAQRLAAELGVSERTVYRDVRDLTLSGVPIEGEAGVGYVLRRGFQVPPLMFTAEELRALVLGARMVQGFSDPALQEAVANALVKIEAVLPDALKGDLDDRRLMVPDCHVPPSLRKLLGLLRAAIDERRKLRFAYTRRDGERSFRVVRPLALAFWGPQWTLAAWCELREDFRTFRLDRISALTVETEVFADERGRTVEDYLRSVGD